MNSIDTFVEKVMSYIDGKLSDNKCNCTLEVQTIASEQNSMINFTPDGNDESVTACIDIPEGAVDVPVNLNLISNISAGTNQVVPISLSLNGAAPEEVTNLTLRNGTEYITLLAQGGDQICYTFDTSLLSDGEAMLNVNLHAQIPRVVCPEGE